MPKATQPVSVDGIEFDALIDESRTLSANIPDYPTEEGFMVSDTITLQPLALNMTLFLSDTPVTWRARLGAIPGRSEIVLERLMQTYKKRQLITVVTAKKTYKNMGITNIQISRSLDDGYAYKIPIALKEVRVTKTKTVDIPASYGKSGSTGVSAGNVNTGGSGGGIGGGGGGGGGKSDAYNLGFSLFGG
jgi:uncharacterized membrane protein YgcG